MMITNVFGVGRGTGRASLPCRPCRPCAAAKHSVAAPTDASVGTT